MLDSCFACKSVNNHLGVLFGLSFWDPRWLRVDSRTFRRTCVGIWTWGYLGENVLHHQISGNRASILRAFFRILDPLT